MSRVCLLGLWLFSMVAPGYSQLVSLGVKAGVPINDAVHGTGPTLMTDTGRWIVGPTGELHLPFHVSFEVDALYRSESYRVNAGDAGNRSIDNWQFPFLGKYQMRGEVLRPFVDAGVTYRHLTGDGPILHADSSGFTIGGGLELKPLFLRFSPEIRYTRWGGGNALDGLHATQSQNQGDFLVGFSF